MKDSKNKLIKAYRECLGVVKCACEKSQVSRKTFYDNMKDENFKKAINEINEEQIDFVETKMLDGINKGNDKLIQFYLRTKGKSRGYGESTDITSNGESITPTINISIINPNKE
jgi:hypothetical protein